MERRESAGEGEGPAGRPQAAGLTAGLEQKFKQFESGYLADLQVMQLVYQSHFSHSENRGNINVKRHKITSPLIKSNKIRSKLRL